MLFRLTLVLLGLIALIPAPSPAQTQDESDGWKFEIIREGNALFHSVNYRSYVDPAGEWAATLALVGETDQAVQQAEALVGHRRLEVLLRVAEDLVALGRVAEANRVLDRAVRAAEYDGAGLVRIHTVAQAIVYSESIERSQQLLDRIVRETAAERDVVAASNLLAPLSAAAAHKDLDTTRLRASLEGHVSRCLQAVRQQRPFDDPVRRRLREQDDQRGREYYWDLQSCILLIRSLADLHQDARVPDGLSIATDEAVAAGHIEGLLSIASVHRRAGRDQEADAVIEDVRSRIQRGFNKSELQFAIRALLSRGFLEDARRLMDRTSKLERRGPYGYFEQLVEAALAHDRADYALAVVRDRLRKERTVASYGHLAWAADSVGDDDLARQAFVEAVERIRPWDAWGLRASEQGVDSLGRYELEVLSPHVYLWPKKVRPKLLLDKKDWIVRKSLVLASVGEFDRARQVAGAVIDEPPFTVDSRRGNYRAKGLGEHLAELANHFHRAGRDRDVRQILAHIVSPLNRRKALRRSPQELAAQGLYCEALEEAKRSRSAGDVLLDYGRVLREYHRRKNPTEAAVVDQADRDRRRQTFVRRRRQ